MLRRIAISKKQHKDNNNTNNMSFTLGYLLGRFLYWNSFVFNKENKLKRMPFWNHIELLYWYLHLILITTYYQKVQLCVMSSGACINFNFVNYLSLLSNKSKTLPIYIFFTFQGILMKR